MAIDIEQMLQRLVQKQQELQDSIAALTEARPHPVDAVEASDGSQDFEDVAVDFLEMQQEQSVLVNQQALLTEVQRAIERIDTGTYGKCVECGQPIPEKRLEVLPWAARDVKCEEKLEQKNLGVTETYNTNLN